jgi:hypothetical protein
MEIAEWLRGLGLGQYASVFAVNDIDGEVLPKLTADDLRHHVDWASPQAAGGDRRPPRRKAGARHRNRTRRRQWRG